jgi:hypothetical protein
VGVSRAKVTVPCAFSMRKGVKQWRKHPKIRIAKTENTKTT